MFFSITAVSSDYADVFVQASTSIFTTLSFTFLILSVIFFVAALFWAESTLSTLLLTLGLLMASLSVLFSSTATVAKQNAREDNVSNMVANVEKKYDLELVIPKALKLDNINEVADYSFKTDDGATASYRMYFEKTGEPVIVQAPAVPTVEELNQTAEKK